MGYESRIYIVEKTNCCWSEADKGMKYASILAIFDMCKFYEFSDWFRNKPATEHYIYADDGTQIVKDCYGDALKEASIKEVVYKLEKIIENGEDYRRIFPLLATLKVFEAQNNRWSNIAVLHYGY